MIHQAYHKAKNQILHMGKEAFWVVSGQILSVAILFAGVRLMTHVMSPVEYGKLAIIMSIVNGVLYSVGQSLKMAATRYYSVMANDKNPDWYWNSLLKIIGYAASVFIGFAVLCFFFNIGMIWSMASLLGFIVLVNAIVFGVQNGARNRKAFVFHQVVFDGARFCLAFIFASNLTGSALDAVTGFVVAGIMVMFSQLYFFLKQKSKFYCENSSTDTKRLKQFYSYTWPLIIGGVLGWVQIFSDRWAIKFLVSYADVGVYFVLYQTMYSLWVYGTSMLDNFLGAIFFSKVKDCSDPLAFMKMLKINEYVTGVYLICVLCCFLLLVPLKGFLCSLLFAEEYRTAADLLPWMTLSGGLYGIGQQLLYSVYGGASSRRIIPVRIISMLGAIALHFAGAFYWGLKGVVIGGLFFSIFYMLMTLTIHLKVKKQTLKKIKS